MFRRIHGDEHWRLHGLAGCHLTGGRTNRDAAVGRVNIVISVDCHDVVELGDRPIAPKLVVLVQVHRVFFSESFKKIPVGVVLEQNRVQHVYLLEWYFPCVRNVREIGGCFTHRCIRYSRLVTALYIKP